MRAIQKSHVCGMYVHVGGLVGCDVPRASPHLFGFLLRGGCTSAAVGDVYFAQNHVRARNLSSLSTSTILNFFVVSALVPPWGKRSS